MELLEKKVAEVEKSVRRAHISVGIANYVWKAVLIPRMSYPLVAAGVGVEPIKGLEGKMNRWILPKTGMPVSFPRDLLRGPRGEAGGAEPGLMGVVVQAKCHTAMDLWGHPDPRVRAVWEGMRWRGYMAMQSGRLTLGGKIGEVEGILEQRSQGREG